MGIITHTIDYQDEQTLLEAYIAFDDEQVGKRPAVLINHAWGGRNAFVEEKAVELAKLGYLGFALDMYGKGILGTEPEENASLMQPFLDDRTMLLQRIQSALAEVKRHPQVDADKIAAIGFCFGGLCVLDLARSGVNIQGVVSFHGLLSAPDIKSPEKIKAKVLVLHGHDDPMVPVEKVLALQSELTEADADWQLHSYGNTMHAFTNPIANDPDFGTVYQAQADRRSWQSMKNFLVEIFYA